MHNLQYFYTYLDEQSCVRNYFYIVSATPENQEDPKQTSNLSGELM